MKKTTFIFLITAIGAMASADELAYKRTKEYNCASQSVRQVSLRTEEKTFRNTYSLIDKIFMLKDYDPLAGEFNDRDTVYIKNTYVAKFENKTLRLDKLQIKSYQYNADSGEIGSELFPDGTMADVVDACAKYLIPGAASIIECGRYDVNVMEEEEITYFHYRAAQKQRFFIETSDGKIEPAQCIYQRKVSLK